MLNNRRFKKILIGVLFLLPFLVGLLIDSNKEEVAMLWMFIGMIYVAAIVLAAGGYAIYRFTVKQGVRGAIVGLIILITLIPLVLAGTCGLAVGGSFIRSLMIR